MATITAELAEYSQAVHGVVDDADLARFGVSRTRRGTLLANGILVPMFRGVYRLAWAPETLEARCRAICRAHPTAFVTGRAGGRLWELRNMGRIDRIEVRAPHSCTSLQVPYVLLRRCNVAESVDVVERLDGIRVASPPRLAFDLAADLPPIDLVSVIEQILDRRHCTVQTLYDMDGRLYHPARPGADRFVKVLASRPAWLKPCDSHLEVVLYDALRAAGVTGMTRQHELKLPAGHSIHPDIAVPSLRWAIEVDHVTWHGGGVYSTRDKRNDRQAGMIGWKVDRVPDEDITLHLDQTVADLLVVRDQLLASVRSGQAQAG